MAREKRIVGCTRAARARPAGGRRVAAMLMCVLLTGCGAAQDSTTTVPAPLVKLALSPDGLGEVSFGLAPDTVVDDIAALVGGPDLDSGWIPSEPNAYGSCPGSTMRAIGWGSLVTIFIDDGAPDLGGYFYTYTYGYDFSENEGGIDPRGLDLTTEQGVGLGTTVAALRSAFGADMVVEGDAVLDVWSFRAVSAGFRGLLSGSNDNDTVTLLQPLDGCT